MKLKLLAAALLCGATTAHAQVQYSGPATPGHVPSNVTNGVIQDAGPATAPNATEFGVHKNGGLPFCITDQDNPPPFQDPYNQFCLAVTPQQAQIIVNSSSGPAPTLSYVINGQVIPINPAGVSPPPYYDSFYTTLADADAAATAAGAPLIITKNWTLTAATVLTSPTLVPGGGVIAMNGNNLTLNGQISGPAVKLIDVGAFGAGGTLTINGGKSIIGNWLCGPWGVPTFDYSPCIQAGFNIIFRNNTNPGPRLFDLESFGSQNAGGIFLNEGLTMNAAFEGIVYDPGMSWVMNPDNTMFYAVTTSTSGNRETAGWSFFGSPFTTYGWKNTFQSPTATQAVVFGFFAGDTNADGNHNIVIDGALIVGGYSFMSTEGSVAGFNGWWSSIVRNIYASDVVGPVIFHNPPIGGAERQIYQNILVINNVSSTWPTGLAGQAFVLNDIGGLTLDSWSVDGYGVGGTAVTTPFVSLSNVHSCNLNNGHFEQNTVNLNFTPMINITGSTCRITGLFETATHTSPSSNGFIIEASINSLVSVDDVSITNNTVGSGGTFFALQGGSDNTSQIKVGNLWTQDTSLTGMFNTNLGSGTPFPQQIGYTFESAFPALVGTVTGAVETDLTVGGGTIVGNIAPQGCVISRAVFALGSVLTAGSITLKFYNGTTALTTATLLPASGQSGYLFVSPSQGSTLKLPGGAVLRVTYTNNASAPASDTLQVKVSCVTNGD